MRTEEFGVITFQSTHHAIKGESIIKEMEIPFKTIPTPREITLSCGLSIRFDLKDLDEIIKAMEEKQLAIKGIYRYTREEGIVRLEKIV